MKKTLSEHLSKLKISEARYVEESVKLLNAGFSEKEANKLILRKSSSRTVAAVLNHAEKLSASPYFLTKAPIVQIAAHDGGSRNIEAVQALRFSSEQIVRMSSQDGGSLKWQAVLNHYPRLQGHGYTTDWMVALVIRLRSSNKIKEKQAEICFMSELSELLDEDDNARSERELCEFSRSFEEEDSDIADLGCVEPSEIRCTGKRGNPLSQDPSAENEPISLIEGLLGDNSSLKRSRNEDAEPSDSIFPETSPCGLIRPWKGRRLAFFSASEALGRRDLNDQAALVFENGI